MEISYGKLFKILQDKQIKKTELKEKTKLGWSTISKISNNKEVSMEVLKKICEFLSCDIGDIVEFGERKYYTDNEIDQMIASYHEELLGLI